MEIKQNKWFYVKQNDIIANVAEEAGTLEPDSEGNQTENHILVPISDFDALYNPPVAAIQPNNNLMETVEGRVCTKVHREIRTPRPTNVWSTTGGSRSCVVM